MCNAKAGLTITKTFQSYTVGAGAARVLIMDIAPELANELAAGKAVTLKLVKCAGTGQWSMMVDECECAQPVQLPLPMMELGVCPKP